MFLEGLKIDLICSSYLIFWGDVEVELGKDKEGNYTF